MSDIDEEEDQEVEQVSVGALPEEDEPEPVCVLKEDYFEAGLSEIKLIASKYSF